ncbi:ABC transporter, transmembrane domain, type 1 [Penicillium italicum]|uniref:ABC transporter, transmembrane domain, type 1 n=1 Tax=Penicillium italicum TaxID=40296 RepID=A0A0A2L6C9_PENIT|nr:ABC transporter, transmembrane domain, type 1 [Penicillium italicum]
MMGNLDTMQTKVQAARENELKAGIATYWLDVILAASGSFLNIMSPAITLGLYTLFTRLSGDLALDADRAFTSFALVQMVTLPATSIIFILPEFVTAVTGFDRIQKFLLQPDHQDNRKLPEGQIEHFLNFIYTDQDLNRHNADKLINPDEDSAIKIKFATVRYGTGDQPALKNINLKIQPGWLVLVAGMSGSGKTTLARTILGDVKLQSGSVSTSSVNIAFCAESPWLRDGTIRDIITGPPGSTITDESWYQKVLYACDLEFDIVQLPNGDNTLALAQEVYSGLDILVLDEVLSALDGHILRRVVERLLGPAGLLRELKKTVVLTTNSTNLVQHSDLIVILGPDGSIYEQGTWDEPKIQERCKELELQMINGSIDEKHDDGVKQMNIPRAESSNPEGSINLLPTPADSTAIYSHYIGAIGRYRVLVTVFIFASSATFAMLAQNWLRLWTEDDEHGKQTNFFLKVYFALSIGHWLSLTGLGTIEFLVVPASGRILHDQLLTTIMKAPQSFITSTEIGTTLSRFGQDIKEIDQKLPREFAALGSQAFKLLGQIILLCMSQRYNIIAIPVLAIVVYVIQRTYLLASRQIRGICTETSYTLNNSFAETVEGIATIRAFGWENAYALENSRTLDASQMPTYTLYALEQWLMLVVDLIVAGVALLNVAFIITFTSAMTVGDVGISMNVILMLNVVLTILIQSSANFDTSLGVIARIRSFATTVAPKSQHMQDHPIPESWSSNSEIDPRDIIADYVNTGEHV